MKPNKFIALTVALGMAVTGYAQTCQPDEIA